MGGIWKPAGRSKYRIWYKDQHGIRRTKPGFKDEKASLARLHQLEQDEERRAAGLVVPDREGHKAQLQELIEKHVADMKRRGASADYLEFQAGNLNRLVRREAWTRLGQVTHASMTDALARLDAAGRSHRTVDAYRVSWRMFMEWCVDRRLLEANPISRIKAARNRQPKRPKRATTLGEWLRLLETTPSARRGVYLVAGLTGVRWGELRKLECRDVDLVANRLTLRAEVSKSRRRETVPLLPDVVPTLMEVCRGLSPHQRLFPTVPQPITFKADVEAAGIQSPDESGRHVTFHSLRYFFCTVLARTLPIQVVRLLMRHRDISVTCRTYLDLGLTDVAEAVLKLPPILPAHPLLHQGQEAKDGTRRGDKRSGKR